MKEFLYDVQYKYLRSQGASVVTANRYKRGTTATVTGVKMWLDEWSKNIAEIYDRDAEDILLGLSKSKKSLEEIEALY